MKLKSNIITLILFNIMGASIATAQIEESHTSTTYTTERHVTETVTKKTVKQPTVQAQKKVVIYVRNDSGDPKLGKEVKNLEYALASRINNMGFGVINHDLVVRNLNSYLQDPNAQYRSEASKLKQSMKEDSLDMKLFENASGLRMSEFIGADYILSLSISNLGIEKRKFDAYGVKTTNVIYNLRSNYNLCEAGGAIGTAGGAIKATKAFRQSENLEIESSDIIFSLLEDTAGQMAVLLDKQNKANQIIAKEDVSGEIRILYAIEGMSFPELREREDGTYELGTQSIPATIAYVNAEIDGITQTIGSTISLSKGLHTLKINQKDIVPVEKNIFVTGKADQVIAFNLQLTEAARNRWKKDMEFVESLKEKAEDRKQQRMLNEAEAERLKGIAKMFEQSGFKVEVNATELPDVIENNKSLF